MIITQKQIDLFNEKIRAADSIFLFAHKNPDGDAMCSVLALGRLIELNYGKDVTCVYDGNIPNDFNSLVNLPGIGRKTANVVLSEGFNVPRIAVDTHVLRVSNRLGLSDSDNPNIVEADLMNIFEQSTWSDVHLKLLFFGRYHCKSKNPNCFSCFYNKTCKYDKKYTS